MIKKLQKAIIASVMSLCMGVAADAQYCTPSFNYPCGYWGGHMHIKSVSTTGGSTNITNNNTGCSNGSGYSFFSSKPHTSVQGTTVNYSLGNCPYYTQHFVLWVDFNCDGDFTDAGEEIYKGQINYGGTKTGSFTIPITATPGTSRMRVRCIPTWYSAPGPCGSTYYGEAEDYPFIIVPACSTKFDKPIDPYTFACANGEGAITVNDANGQFYQWQVMTGSSFVNLADGGMYSDVTKKTLKMHNVPASMAGTKYRCIVTPTCGAVGKKESDTIALNIRPNVKLLSQTIVDTSCYGLTTVLWYKANEAISQSLWEIDMGTGGGYQPITAPQFLQLDDSLIISNIPDTLNGAKIRCTFTGICGTLTTKDMTLSVNPVPEVIVDPRDTLVKPGVNVPFKVEASGIGVQYQWQVGVNGSFVNINNGPIYTGVKTPVLTMNGASYAQNNFQFRCLISGSGSCKGSPDTSYAAVLSVEKPASVKDIVTENSISIYPNPAKGNEVIIKSEDFVASYLATYVLTDKTGKTITVGNMLADGKPTTINISKLPSDMYFIQIMDKDNATVKSLKFTKL